MFGYVIYIDKIANFKIPIRSYFLIFDTIQIWLVTEVKEIGNAPFWNNGFFVLFISIFAYFIIVTPWEIKYTTEI